MNHQTARELADATGWHYVTLNRRTGGHPIGYCADHDPHPTEAEARECYARYERDRIRLNRGPTSWTSCMAGRRAGERCPNPTQHYADVEGDGYSMAPLCAEHMTHGDAVAALGCGGPAGDRWHS